MDNWDAGVVYRIAIDRHLERTARGEAAQWRGAALGTGPARIRLATALVRLAARLVPETVVASARRPAIRGTRG